MSRPREYRCLSVQQPWANMIADGEKTIETRTWPTSYRGDLVIVSSKTPKIEPAGCAVAVCRLIGCRRMTKDDEPRAGCELYPGAWAWILAGVTKVEPVPVSGALGIYTRELELVEPRPGGGDGVLF